MDPKYKSYLNRANVKGLELSLTEKEFKRMLQMSCFYCGGHRWKGLTRIDNRRGYSLENVRVACHECMMMKSDRDEEEFLSYIRQIYNHVSSSSSYSDY